MTYRVKNITIAVALALVAALLTSFYVTNYQRNVRKDETNVPSASPSATSRPARRAQTSSEGHAREERDRPPQRRPGRDLEPDQVAELVATQPIYAGEQVSTRRFATPSQRGIQAQLKGVQRAIESPATRTSCSRARSRRATTSTSSPRSALGGENGRRRHADRPPRHRGAQGAGWRRPEAEDHVGSDGTAASSDPAVTDTQAQKLLLGLHERGRVVPPAAPGSTPRTARRASSPVSVLARRRPPEAARRRRRGQHPGHWK